MSECIINSHDIEICCETFGDPQDPALLLIIGAGASMLRWEESFIERLVDGGRYVIRFDNRDTGRTTSYPPGEPPYTLADMAADAIAVLDAYHVESAHIIGRSMGGMIAQHLLFDYSSRVRTATLIYSTPSNSISGGSEDELPGMSDKLIEANAQTARASDDGMEQRRAQLKSMEILQGSRFPFNAEKTMALIEWEKARALNYASAGNHGIAIRNSKNWRHRLPEIDKPTLIVHGTEDPIFDVAHARALSAEIEGSDVMWIEGMGHVLPEGVWDDLVPRILAHTER